MTTPDEAKAATAAGYDPNDAAQLDAYRGHGIRRAAHVAALEFELAGYKATRNAEAAAGVEAQLAKFRGTGDGTTRTAVK